MKRLRALLYLVYLFAVVFLVLEVCLRFGLISTERYMIETTIAGIGPGQRVLILGDSFSVDTEDSFVRLLTEYLSSRNCRTLNLARSGLGPRDYLDMLERYGADFHPQLVIVNTYVGNDTSDTAYREERTRGYKDSVKRVLSRSYTGALLFEIRDRMILRSRLKHVTDVREQEKTAPASPLNPFLLELSWSHPDCFLTNLLMETPEALRAWEKNQSALLAMKRIADSMNARFLLNIFPDSLQVNESHHAFYAHLGFRLDPRILSTSVPQDQLARFCEDNHLTCLDLLPAFRARKEREFYKSDDNHWNAEGNRFAFETVRMELDRFLTD